MSNTILCSATPSDTFRGIGAEYKLVRFQRGSVVKIEVYRLDPNGLEMFVGHAPARAWQQRNECPSCKAIAGAPCRSLGKISTAGNVMHRAHGARRTAAQGPTMHLGQFTVSNGVES